MDEIQQILDSLIGRTIEDCGIDDAGDFFVLLDGDETLWCGQDEEGEMFLCFGEHELDS